jgi:hypothetical protein
MVPKTRLFGPTLAGGFDSIFHFITAGRSGGPSLFCGVRSIVLGKSGPSARPAFFSSTAMPTAVGCWRAIARVVAGCMSCSMPMRDENVTGVEPRRRFYRASSSTRVSVRIARRDRSIVPRHCRGPCFRAGAAACWRPVRAISLTKSRGEATAYCRQTLGMAIASDWLQRRASLDIKIMNLRTHSESYVTTSGLAEYWQVSRKQIYKQIDAGTLVAIRLGPRSLRIRTAEAIRFEEIAKMSPPSERDTASHCDDSSDVI